MHGFCHAERERAARTVLHSSAASPARSDVQIEILFCGVCHSDLHRRATNGRSTVYPVRARTRDRRPRGAVGGEVTRSRTGDLAAVGCMVDSCRTCATCRDGLEQYCENGFTVHLQRRRTRASAASPTAAIPSSIVVDEAFVLRISDKLDLAGRRAAALRRHHDLFAAAPLEGRHRARRSASSGLGGLGHMGVKFAHALGAHVGAVHHLARQDARTRKRLGADEVVISKNADEMAKHASSFDFILDTVAAPHDLDAFIDAAQARRHADPGRRARAAACRSRVFSLIFERRSFAGSLIGGIAETQEMLDFCAEHGIIVATSR